MAGELDPNRVSDLMSALSRGDTSAAVRSAGALGIRRITFWTRFTPKITWSPFSQGPSGEPVPTPPASSWSFAGVVQPTFELETAIGTETIAPGGVATDNYAVHIIAAGAGLVALLALVKGAWTIAKGAAIAGGVLLVAGEISRRSAA